VLGARWRGARRRRLPGGATARVWPAARLSTAGLRPRTRLPSSALRAATLAARPVPAASSAAGLGAGLSGPPTAHAARGPARLPAVAAPALTTH